MRTLQHHRDTLQFLQRNRVPAPVLQAFGDLIDDAEELWRTRTDGRFEGAQGQLSTTIVAPPQFTNYNTSFLAPFVTGTTSVQVLPANARRTMLVIQNLSSASDLFFNLGGGASLNNGLKLSAGAGFVFDSVCPIDSVNMFYNNATPQLGAVLEVRFTAV